MIKAGKCAGSKEGLKSRPLRTPFRRTARSSHRNGLTLAQLTSDDIERTSWSAGPSAANFRTSIRLAPLEVKACCFTTVLETEGDPYLGQALYRFDSQSLLEEFSAGVAGRDRPARHPADGGGLGRSVGTDASGLAQGAVGS